MHKLTRLLVLAFVACCCCQPQEPQHKLGASTDVGTLNQLTQPTSTSAITPNDGTDVSALCTKGAWVGGAGDLAVKARLDSGANTLKSVPAGSFVAGQFSRIMSTNTTATFIVCFGNE